MTEIPNIYKIDEIKTIRELKEIFNKGGAWLFLSTEGYHGTKLTLDDLEAILHDEHDITADINGRYWLTVLIVFPQNVSASTGVARAVPLLKYGEILIDLEDIQWLREAVRATLDEVSISQTGNT